MVIAEKPPIESGKIRDDTATVATSINHFITPGMLLFIDQLIVAAAGWLFWIMIPRFTTTSEIGQATSIYSLVLLVNTIIQLGLEYPLLKKSNSSGSRPFGTIMVIELALTAASIIPIFFIFDNVYHIEQSFIWSAIGILIFSSMSFVARFALLGASNAKNVLIFDIIGTAIKFVTGIVLVSNGYGAAGILFAFVAQAIVVSAGTLFVAHRLFGLKAKHREGFTEILKDGLVNSPSKLSNMLIVSLSVVLLTTFGVEVQEVGIFYIAVMVSIVVGSFASSLAYMSIPASSSLKTDLSSGSLRLGLGFTAPIIAALIVAPGTILSIVGTEYAEANEVLMILAAGVLPSMILSNAISKFNNLNKPLILLIIGSVRIITFLVAFYLLVPQYGIVGASYAILISFTVSAILSLVWSEKILLKYLTIAILSIGIGVLAGQLEQNLIGLNPVVSILISVGIAFSVILGLKCVSIKEISGIIRMLSY